MAQHLLQAIVGAELFEVVQTVSAYSIQQDEAFHKGGFIVAALSLFDLYMPCHTLCHFQRAQSTDQQRCPTKRRQLLRCRLRIDLKKKIGFGGTGLRRFAQVFSQYPRSTTPTGDLVCWNPYSPTQAFLPLPLLHTRLSSYSTPLSLPTDRVWANMSPPVSQACSAWKMA